MKNKIPLPLLTLFLFLTACSQQLWEAEEYMAPVSGAFPSINEEPLLDSPYMEDRMKDKGVTIGLAGFEDYVQFSKYFTSDFQLWYPSFLPSCLSRKHLLV